MVGIVVGVDGSQTSSAALAHGLELAARTGWRVTAVHCWQTPLWVAGPPGFPVEAAPDPAAAEAWSRTVVQQAVDEATRVVPGGAMTQEVRHGEPARELLAAADGAGLLVVGGRAHGAVARLLLGSVTDEVLHAARCPVLVVPSTAALPWRRVVVGLDGSAPSRAALRWAAFVARAADLPLVVVRAWMLSTVPGIPVTGDTAEQDGSAAVCRWLAAELSRQVPAEEQPREVVTTAMHTGASAALLDTAGSEDLLVVGARGQGGFAGLVLGSVATQCARHTHGPLVVVPASG